MKLLRNGVYIDRKIGSQDCQFFISNVYRVNNSLYIRILNLKIDLRIADNSAYLIALNRYETSKGVKVTKKQHIYVMH